MDYKLENPHTIGKRPVSDAQPDPKAGLWVCEQDGRIFKYDPATFDPNTFSVKERLVLDITTSISNLKKAANSFGDERGLIGLALHANFENEKKFFVHYSANSKMGESAASNDKVDHFSVISEFNYGPDATTVRQSERVLFTVPQPEFNHNGGALLHVIKEGKPYLIIGFGDGGGKNDEHPNQVSGFGEVVGNAVLVGNDRKNLLGTLLVIDLTEFEPMRSKLSTEEDFESWLLREDSKESETEKASPVITSSPSTYTMENLRGYIRDTCIVAVGLRNPFKISFHGDSIYIADVGQSKYERVLKLGWAEYLSFRVEKKPVHYGWNAFEGSSGFGPFNQQSSLYFAEKKEKNLIKDAAVPPFVLYDRTQEPISAVIGGYHDKKGNYIYGDYNGRIFVKFDGPEDPKFIAKLPEGEFLHSFAITSTSGREVFAISFNKTKEESNIRKIVSVSVTLDISIKTEEIGPVGAATETPKTAEEKPVLSNQKKGYKARTCFEGECEARLKTDSVVKILESLKEAEKRTKSKIRKVGNDFVDSKLTKGVLDENGEFYYHTTEGAWFLSVGCAESKAITAFGFSSNENVTTTKSLIDLSTPHNPLWGIHTIHPEHQLTSIPGGVPIYNAEGILLGAVGVSGDHPDVDHQVAVSGIEDAGFFTNPDKKKTIELFTKPRVNFKLPDPPKKKPAPAPKRTVVEFVTLKIQFPVQIDPEQRYRLASKSSDPDFTFIYDEKNLSRPLKNYCQHKFSDQQKLIQWYEANMKKMKTGATFPICPTCYNESKFKKSEK